MPESALPDNLKGQKHLDWLPGFRWVPRGLTAFKWGEPELIWGRLKSTDYIHFHFKDEHPRSEGFKRIPGGVWCPVPITSPGTWQFTFFRRVPWWARPLSFYFAFSTRVGKDGQFRHFRIGARWDDVNGYTEILSIATRKYPEKGERDTST